MKLKLLIRLVTILSKRAFWSFGVVTFLVASLLASVNIASRYAVKSYVEDQLQRIPWDLVIYQSSGFSTELISELSERVSSVEGLKQVEIMTLLRAKLPARGEVIAEVDGKPLATPWLSILAATDLGLLPPKLDLALRNLDLDAGRDDVSKERGAILALVGPERAMGGAFLALQGSERICHQSS